MIKRILAFVPLLLLPLIGCVSAPKNIELAEAPASAAYPQGNGKAEIVVVRKGISAFTAVFGVHVNDEKIGAVRVNDFVATQVDPGVVTVLASAEASCTAQFPVEANRTYYLRAVPKTGWWYARVQLELLDPEDGAAYREDCDDMTIGAEDDTD